MFKFSLMALMSLILFSSSQAEDANSLIAHEDGGRRGGGGHNEGQHDRDHRDGCGDNRDWHGDNRDGHRDNHDWHGDDRDWHGDNHGWHNNDWHRDNYGSETGVYFNAGGIEGGVVLPTPEVVPQAYPYPYYDQD